MIQLCYILDATILETDQSPSSSKIIDDDRMSDENLKVTDELEAIFISTLYASLGAPLEGDSRLLFDQLVKKISGLLLIDDSPSKKATYSECYFFFFFVLKYFHN